LHVPTLPVTPVEIGVALGLVIIGSILQGSVGFGLAVVAAPILMLINPVFIPGPLLFATVLLVLLIALRDRREVIASDVGLGIFGRMLGTLPAAYAISTLPVPAYELLFAGLVMFVVIISSSGWHITATKLNVIIAAMISGFSGTVGSIGGPPMALVYQHERGPRIRGTISTIFTFGTMISVAGLWWAGRFGEVEFFLGLLMMPAVALGFAISRYTACRIDRAHTRPAVLAIAGLSAIVIMLRALSAYF
jgi:uncharacterized protein